MKNCRVSIWKPRFIYHHNIVRFSHLEDVWNYFKLRNILDIIILIIRHSTDRSWLAIVHKLKFDSMKCLLTMNEHEFSLAFIRWMDIWSCLFLTGQNLYKICTLEWNVFDICISRTIDIFLEFHYFKLHAKYYITRKRLE